MDQEDWGWKLQDEELEPVTMTQVSGPYSVLNMIFCSCSFEISCGELCGYRKHNLPCNITCKKSFGTNCTNPTGERNVSNQNDEECKEEREEEDNYNYDL